MPYDVVALLPTRGLVFGKTLETLFDTNFAVKPIVVSGLPIPEAQNEMVRRGMKTGCPWFLMLEEDMVIPPGALEKMVDMDKDVVCVDYPVISGWSTIKKVNGEILHCGLGCTLIKRKVFEVLPEPWFRIDQSIDAKTGEVLDIPMKYGGHDILFGLALKEHGFKIYQLEGFECGHLRCPDLNRRESNNGIYNIVSLPPVSKRQEG
jgi:hypothetical protein